MTFAPKALAAAVLAAASLTGLSACGGDDVTKVSDKEFITRCKKSVDDNQTFKAYGTDICNCVQKKLEDKGLGDKNADSKSIKPEGTQATVECVREVTQQS